LKLPHKVNHAERCAGMRGDLCRSAWQAETDGTFKPKQYHSSKNTLRAICYQFLFSQGWEDLST
jgi:hypothetical protein